MEKERPNRTAFISVLSIATFVMALSMLALAPATASLMTIWHVSFAQVEWLTTVFLLVMCISMLISPWLFQNVGFRKLILMLLGCFVAGTLLLVLTPWYSLALVGRILEAIALGIMFPLYQSALLVITTGDKQKQVMGIAGAVMSFAIVGGPAIVELALMMISWRGFYGLLAAIVALDSLGALYWITAVMPIHRQPFDWRSMVYSLGIVGLLYVINASWAQRRHLMLGLLVISLVLLLAFWFRQLTSKRPLLQVRVLHYRRFDLCLLLSGVAYMSLVGLTVLLPLFYRQILVEHGLMVSFALLIPALFLVLTNLATSRLADLMGDRVMLALGMTILAGSFLLLAIGGPSLTVVKLIADSSLAAIGASLVLMPATTQGAAQLPSDLVAHGITLITVIRQLLGSLGTAALTLLLMIAPGEAGFVRVFCLFALIDLIILGTLLLALFGGFVNENSED